jgi:hypothetical protein
MLKNMRSTLLVASTLAMLGGIGMAAAQVPDHPGDNAVQDRGIRKDCGTEGDVSALTRQAAPSEAAREAARSRAQAPAAGKGTVGAAVEPIHPGDNPAQDRNCTDD